MKNFWTAGYKIWYPEKSSGLAYLSMHNGPALVRLEKKKNSKKSRSPDLWIFYPMTLKDEDLDKVLPINWRTRLYSGFSSISEFKSWANND